MNEQMDEDFEIRLPERFEGPVPDGGFCDRVMDQLPPRRRHIKWPMAAGTAAGLATCGFSLWFAPIMHVGWRDWLAGELSVSAIVLFFSMVSMAILALAWTAAEADDRHAPASRRVAG